MIQATRLLLICHVLPFFTNSYYWIHPRFVCIIDITFCSLEFLDMKSGRSGLSFTAAMRNSKYVIGSWGKICTYLPMPLQTKLLYFTFLLSLHGSRLCLFLLAILSRHSAASPQMLNTVAQFLSVAAAVSFTSKLADLSWFLALIVQYIDHNFPFLPF